MTNEEKALQITEENKKLLSKFNPKNPPSYEDGMYYGAIEMARWKDRQFKEYLEKVREMIRNSENPQIEPLINAMIEWIEK